MFDLRLYLIQDILVHNALEFLKCNDFGFLPYNISRVRSHCLYHWFIKSNVIANASMWYVCHMPITSLCYPILLWHISINELLAYSQLLEQLRNSLTEIDVNHTLFCPLLNIKDFYHVLMKDKRLHLSSSTCNQSPFVRKVFNKQHWMQATCISCFMICLVDMVVWMMRYVYILVERAKIT